MAERLLAPRWSEPLRRGIGSRETLAAREGARIAIISDTHGNLTALQAVVADFDLQRVDHVLAAGDMAQGGCRPDSVVDVLRERRWPTVLGNSDALLLDVHDGVLTLPPEMEPFAATARWSLRRLGPDRIAYLGSLPAALRVSLPGNRSLLLVHATTWSLEDAVTPETDDTARARMLADGRADVLVHGHIHTAYHRVLPGGILVSAGAVSGSNDQDPRPAYTVLGVSSDGVTLEVRRAEMDLEAEREAVRRSDLPDKERVLRIVARPGPWPVRSASGPGTTVHLPWSRTVPGTGG